MGNLKIKELLFNLKKGKSAIWTEDDKLKIRISNIQENIEEIKSILTAEKQNIVEVLKANNICTPEDFIKTTIIRYSGKTAPLSYAQERMLLIEEFSSGEDSAYHMPALFQLNNEVDDKGIEYAISAIGKRHHILRTTMQYDHSAQEWQQIINRQDIQVEYFNCNDADFELELERLISKRFNLNSDYPIRAVIIQTSSEKFLLLTLHHIAADGWSVEIFEKELVFLYEKFLGIHTGELPELSVQYNDYAQWQRYYLKGKTLQDQLNYWKDFLQDFSTLKLPFDYQRPSKVSYNGDFVSFTFSQEISDKIRKLATELSTTPHCILLSGFSVLLGKYSSQNDIVLGTPVANRHFSEISGLIGFFVNTVVNRIGLKRNETFRQLVNRVHLQQVELQQYQDVPFQKLIEELGVSRDLSANPIFQVFFTTQKFGNFDESLSSPKYFESVALDNFYRKEKFDLSVFMKDSQEQISGDVSYSVDLFGKETIARFVNHYRELLKELLENDNFYDTVSLLNATERKVILEDFNDTDADFPADKTIIDLFEEQVERSPDHVALSYYGKTWTYREVNEEANRLSDFLNKEYHSKANDIIGIKLERSDRAVIAILAVLKAGAAYAPIDPGYPKERIDYIKEDIQSKVIIDETFIDHFNTIKEKYSTDNQKRDTTCDDLLYVIYTSGTTGNPKGIMMRNFSMVNLICATINDLKFVEKIMHFANCSFDVSFQEIFTALLAGKTLYPIKEQSKKDINELCLFIAENKIDTLFFPTSYFKLLIENEIFLTTLNTDINHLILAGEKLTLNEKIIEKCTFHNILIHNHYGPSETHVVTTYTITPGTSEAQDMIPPIGKPIPNTRIYILDDNSNPVLVGVPGNLYISGVGLSRGYLNKPELTAEKFVANPFTPGIKMYDTGDVARWLPDGNIEYLGRKDFQVKIRGYRIELGEIETSISHFNTCIKQVVAEAKEVNGEKVLIVYYTNDSENSIDKSALREYLQGKLPEYMVPGFFVELASIPLTSNGKIDRRALPDITGEDVIRKEYVAPRNETEQKLSEIWEKVLGVEKVGITDNFFELGGHSLMVVQVLNRMHQTLSMQLSFKDFFASPTIKGITKNLTGKEYIPIPQAAADESYPLTPSQHRLWVLSQLEGGSQAYNMPAVVSLKGTLNKEYFEKSFQYLIARHEILRTSFKSDKITGEIRQYITPKEELHFTIEVLDFTGKADSEIEGYLQSSNDKSFNLEESPLIRASLLKRGNEEHLFFLSMHHIIGDGWSTEVLVSEVVENYNNLLNGNTKEGEILKEELAIQYKDYAVWLQEEIKGEKYQRAEAYWLEQFEGELPILELPSYRTRPLIQTYNGDSLSHLFSKEFTKKLEQYSEKHGATLFMTLMAGVKSLLYRYTGQQDIIVGTPIAGREHPDLESQLGLYLNTLAIRTRLAEDHNTFESVLGKEKETLLSAYEHQLYPFDELVGKLNLKRDTSRSALFDVTVGFQNQSQLHLGNTSNDIDGLQVEGYDYHRKTSQFDMGYTFAEEAGQLGLTIEYNTDIYDDFLVQRIFSHFENLLTKAIEDREGITNIEDLDYLTSEERDLLLAEFNDTKVDYPRDKTIIQLFEEQVDKTPDHVAVVFEESELTYRELNEEANQLGDYLRQNYHIEADDLLAVKLERSEKMIVAILGILKSGAAYVPIDPEYPQERIEYMITDSQCKVVLDDEVLFSFQENKEHYSASNLKSINGPEDIAYIIYTSGTTGNQKGVMIEHRNVVSLLKSERTLFDFNSQDVWTMFHSYCFDFSVWEMYGALLNGGKLIIIPLMVAKDPDSFLKVLKKEKVTILNQTPSVFYNVIEEDQRNIHSGLQLRYVIFGGEALSPGKLSKYKRKYPDTKLINMYGITETTVHVTYKEITEKDISNNISNIGTAISTLNCYILDEHQQLVPMGVTGELYVGGDGVARGYLNREELTSLRFISNPFKKGDRLYRSGDEVRLLADGELEYLGRKDSQVKIRGYRIELGEIETNISQFNTCIKQVVAEAKEVNGEKVLVVYYTNDRETSIDKSELREYLQSKLPEYMIPGFFVELENIPLTSNGKIDRKALPEVSRKDLIRREYVAPANETEKKLSEIWQEVLGVEKVGITDNFFELGGHSLMVVQVLNRMHQTLSMQLSFKDFFASPTIKGISSGIITKEYIPIPKAPEQESYPLTSSQQRLWILSQLEGGSQAYNMPAVVSLKGKLNKEYFEKSFQYLIARHEILRTSFKSDKITGEIRQYITPNESLAFSIEVLDFTGKTDSEIEDYLQSSNDKSFNLEESPLIRAFLLKRGNEEHLFFLSMHHIIGDGWSTEVLVSEVVDTYNRLLKEENGSTIDSNGNKGESPELSIQYKDYAVWLQEEIKGEKYQRAEAYWLEQFEGELPVLELPSYKTRPLIQTYNGDSLSHLFSKEFTEKLEQYSEKHGATLFMTLMAGVKSLLYRYTGQQDIIVGTPIAGREHPDLESQIGLYLNILAIRTKLEDNHNTFESVLGKEKETLLSAYEHQLYSFDELVTKLNMKRDPSRSVLFDVTVGFHNQSQLHLGNTSNDIDGLQVEGYDYHRKTSQFDMSYTFAEEAGQLGLTIEYNTDIYDEFLIQRIFSHFENLLTKAIEDQEGITNIEDLDYLTSEERDLLLAEFNDTKVDYPKDKTIIQLFEEQVDKTPDHVAVVFEESELTYRELNEEANQLGDYLRQNYHIEADDLLAVKLERSEKMIVAILGILKSGAAYVPIDPEYPQERIEYIEHDTKAKVTIDETFLESYQKYIQNSVYPYTKGNLPIISRPDSLAYVIYTSGTTGDPKGVMIENKSVLRLVKPCSYFPLNENNVLMSTGAINFDATIIEYFGTLLNGAKLILISNYELLDVELMGKQLNKQAVDSLWMTASWFSQIIDHNVDVFKDIKQILVGGDKLPPKQIKTFIEAFPHVRILNGYGPTENTTFSTVFLINEVPDKSIPIGKPIENSAVYILDEKLHPVSVGVKGTLYVSGDGLSRGYLNKPELTSEKFITNPFEEGTKMYDTGDLARWLPDGNIEFLGRKDFQVKIRGYRIELGEIEVNINRFSNAIKQVVVDTREVNGGKVLVAYYTKSEESGIDKAELRQYLQNKLPEYMVPGFFIELETVPLTPNGKTDRKALPSVIGEDLIRSEFVAPENEIEKKLVEILQKVLEVETVGVTDNFFDLGGHSLLMIDLQNEIFKQWNVKISLSDIFEKAVIKNLSIHISQMLELKDKNNPELLQDRIEKTYEF